MAKNVTESRGRCVVTSRSWPGILHTLGFAIDPLGSLAWWTCAQSRRNTREHTGEFAQIVTVAFCFETRPERYCEFPRDTPSCVSAAFEVFSARSAFARG
jgi:hypothetical protein